MKKTNGGGQRQDGQPGNADPLDTLDYPCRFDVKAMGRQGNRFSALVHGVVSRHIDVGDLLHTQTRPSRRGKYQAITCTIRARSKQQIQAIYADLAACAEVLMML